MCGEARIKVVDAEQKVTIGRLITVAEVHFTDSLQDGMGVYSTNGVYIRYVLCTQPEPEPRQTV